MACEFYLFLLHDTQYVPMPGIMPHMKLQMRTGVTDICKHLGIAFVFISVRHKCSVLNLSD